MIYKFYGRDDEAVRLPSKVEVCGYCGGRGTQDCFDGGMTADEMYEAGDDFIDDYRAGVYDKPCEECNGRNVVVHIDIYYNWESTRL